MYAFVKKWVSYFLRVFGTKQKKLHFCFSYRVRPDHDLSRELLGETLLLGPLIVVGGGVLFEDLGVFGDEVLAAEGADGHGLCGLDRGAVLVNLHAGAGGVGLLVLAGDAVLLGDRHVG
jgi:hypothetical protein